MLIGTAVVGVALYLYSRRFERLPETKYFQVLILLATAWSALQAIDVCLTALEGKVLLMQMKFIFAPFVCVAVFGLLTGLDGRGDWLLRRNMIAISIVPIVTVLLALTTQSHTLFLYDFYLEGQDPAVLHSTEGIWYQFYLVYSYAVMAIALVVFIDSARGSNPLYKRQAAIIVLSFLPPFLSDILQNYYLLWLKTVDLAPATFMLSGIVMAWGLFRYRLLDVRPIARGEVVENMTDALMVVDTDERLIDLNRSAEPLLTVPSDAALGTPISKAFPFGGDIARMLVAGTSRGVVAVGSGTRRRTYDASIMPIEVRRELRAHMVLLRDITERERAEEALKAANERLGLLSSLTRHDLLNRLTVIDGYVALALKEKYPDKVRTYLEKTERSSEAARALLEFTGDYESVGIKAPVWLRVDEVFARAAGQLPLEKIQVSIRTQGLSVYADAMLEKVFYNLIDNTLRHGGGVSRICLDYEEHGDRLSLIYRDDGVGIPGTDKPLIFLRGFGANTGLGLFLVREVLAITGIEITENGDERKGARFQMLVPSGGYRIEGQVDHAASVGGAESASTEH